MFKRVDVFIVPYYNYCTEYTVFPEFSGVMNDECCTLFDNNALGCAFPRYGAFKRSSSYHLGKP